MTTKITGNGAIAYTDGGCQNGNPGFAGVGIHLAKYSPPPKDGPTPPSTERLFYWGYDRINEKNAKTIVTAGTVERYFGSFDDRVTNNYAELAATLEALRVVKKMTKENELTRLLILSDSTYVINGLDGRTKKQRAGSRKLDVSPTPNARLWNEALAEIDELEKVGCLINFKWVRGHNGDLGNEDADVLATLGVEESRRRLQNTQKEGPGKDLAVVKLTKMIDTNKLSKDEVAALEDDHKEHTDVLKAFKDQTWLFDVRWLFYTTPFRDSDKNIYLAAKPHGVTNADKFQEYLGARSEVCAYRALYIPEEIQYINDLRRINLNEDPDEVGMMTLDLSAIKKKLTQESYETQGAATFVADKEKGQITTGFGDIVAVLNNPLRASYYVLDILKELYLDLEDAMGERKRSKYVDVTEQFFAPKETKKGITHELNPAIIPSTRTFDIQFVHQMIGKEALVGITVDLRQDVFSRNGLKRMEKFDPKIYLVIYDDNGVALKYNIFIQLNNGVCGMFSSEFCNVKFLEMSS